MSTTTYVFVQKQGNYHYFSIEKKSVLSGTKWIVTDGG